MWRDSRDSWPVAARPSCNGRDRSEATIASFVTFVGNLMTVVVAKVEILGVLSFRRAGDDVIVTLFICAVRRRRGTRGRVKVEIFETLRFEPGSPGRVA